MGVAQARSENLITAAVSPPAAEGANAKTSRLPTARLVEAGDLQGSLESWEALAKAAVTPNVFYEHWFLFPALRYLASGKNLRFLMISGPSSRAGVAPLWGFFPLEVQPACLGLPIKTLALWQHDYCFLTTPLVHRDHAAEVLSAFWRWFETNPLGCRLLDTNHLSADGVFHQGWADCVLGRSSFTFAEYPRAALVPAPEGADAYVANLVTRKHHDEFRRLERRLSEMGVVAYQQVTQPEHVDSFVADFLEIESKGWKGNGNGGAFARRAESAAFFEEVTKAGFARGQVMLLSLHLNGQRIALKHNLMTGHGGFTFKIAFNEAFAKYSPGLLLELENIRQVHANSEVRWLDSCATPRHPMANRIWGERRMIRRSLVSNGSPGGDLFLSAFPLLRWIKHKLVGDNIPIYLQKSTNQ